MAVNLTFHIIFCPGTVRYLRLAVLSLLRFSDYRYRLVANGLDRQEMSELREFCRTSHRLEFVPFPTRVMLPHGILLSLLQQRESGERFCFMDSDIFASARFQEQLERHLVDCDVFSSCDLMRFDSTESLVGFGGRCLTSPNGLALATTYFAVYRQELLHRVIVETGVGLEMHPSAEHLSDRIREQLRSLGADDMTAFDTGKLLNVLSHSYEPRFQHVELDGLTHVGGMTSAFIQAGWLKERICAAFRRPYVLRDEDLDPAARLRTKAQMALRRLGRKKNLDWQTQLAHQRVRLRRRRIAKFFAFFVQSLVDGIPEPRLEVSEPILSQRVHGLCEVIRQVHQEDYDRARAA